MLIWQATPGGMRAEKIQEVSINDDFIDIIFKTVDRDGSIVPFLHMRTTADEFTNLSDLIKNLQSSFDMLRGTDE